MNDQFVLLLNKSYLNSGKSCNSGQFKADQTFHYIAGTLLERVRRVHPHPLKFGSGCAAPVLRTFVEDGPKGQKSQFQNNLHTARTSNPRHNYLFTDIALGRVNL